MSGISKSAWIITSDFAIFDCTYCVLQILYLSPWKLLRRCRTNWVNLLRVRTLKRRMTCTSNWPSTNILFNWTWTLFHFLQRAHLGWICDLPSVVYRPGHYTKTTKGAQLSELSLWTTRLICQDDLLNPSEWSFAQGVFRCLPKFLWLSSICITIEITILVATFRYDLRRGYNHSLGIIGRGCGKPNMVIYS